MVDNSNFGLRLLRWCCPPSLYEGIEGDLLEQFENDKNCRGQAKAQLRLAWSAFRFIRPSIILRNKLKANSTTVTMWSNYLKVGWRNIVKNGFYSSINVMGLAFGLGFSYITFLYVSGEFRFDRFHSKADRIVRVVETTTTLSTGDKKNVSAVTSIPLAQRLQASYPEIENSTRFGSWGTVIKINNDTFHETVAVADPSFFDLFDFNSLSGNKKLLVNPYEVVISEKAKQTFFGDQEAVGQDLLITLGDSLHTFTISAVIDNHSQEASQYFNVMIPFSQLRKVVGEEMFESSSYGFIETYLLLQNTTELPTLEQKINNAYKKEAIANGDATVLMVTLQPLTSIRLDDEVPGGVSLAGNPTYVYVLSGVGILILFMASVNFISLTSGHTFSRVKEVGVRKSMGAYRQQIRNQLMLESLIVCSVAAIIGLGMVYFVMPLFNSLINSTVAFTLDAMTCAFLTALILLVVLLAGNLPGRALVSLQPVEALKNKASSSGSKNMLMKGFVIIQFTLSLALIIGTLVMNEQMDFISEKNLGFDKERLFEVSLNSPSSAEDATRLARLFKSKAVSSPAIANVTAEMNDYQEPWTALGFSQEVGEPIQLYFNEVDTDYMQTMGLEMVAGRWFDTNANTSESMQLVVNEAMVKFFGWTDPLSQQIPGKNFTTAHQIIGVVKDFHFSSLHYKVEPLILVLNKDAVLEGVTGLTTYRWPPMFNSLTIKFNPGEIQSAIQEVESIWNEINGDQPFIGHFVDQSLDLKYADEKRWKKIINYSSVFAYFIATLGLIGLVRLLLQRKMKEIGIRKVLGSTFSDLFVHFSKGFAALVMLSCLLAWLLAWWVGERWLQVFTYRIDLSATLFIAGTTMVIAGITAVVGLLTWIASRAEPVDILKNE